MFTLVQLGYFKVDYASINIKVIEQHKFETGPMTHIHVFSKDDVSIGS